MAPEPLYDDGGFRLRTHIVLALILLAALAAFPSAEATCTTEAGAKACAGTHEVQCHRQDLPPGQATGARVDTGSASDVARLVVAAERGNLCGPPYLSSGFDPEARGVGASALLVVFLPDGSSPGIILAGAEWYEFRERCEAYLHVGGIVFFPTPCTLGIPAPTVGNDVVLP